MFETRGHLGQSIYVAIFKMLGDLFASMDNFLRDRKSILLNTLYVGIILLDVIYIVLFLF
jgi:hypothetical protein